MKTWAKNYYSYLDFVDFVKNLNQPKKIIQLEINFSKLVVKP